MKIRLTRAAGRGEAALPKADLWRVDARILALADDPHPLRFQKLQGEGDLDRIRSGDFRILYQAEEGGRVVLVVDVGDRRDIDRPS